MIDEKVIGSRYLLLKGEFDERRRRLWAAAEARECGRGGAAAVARATGISKSTISRGLHELKELEKSGEEVEKSRVRRKGAGRKKAEEKDLTLLSDLEKLVDVNSIGNPENPLCWTSKSTRTLAASLCEMGHQVSHQTVSLLLPKLGYSLQANRKTLEGTTHPDRDDQFNYINSEVQKALDDSQPVISVDTKKRELVGNFKASGKELAPKGKPVEVRTHDFKDPDLGHAIPYGIYDINDNAGWVNVGIDNDTAQFAVNSIRNWWEYLGEKSYRQAKTLTICADAGGSNSYRTRLWKTQLQELADETGLTITVCHFPPGTSKWNKIEHRLFSFITKNWRGKPLKDYQTIINLISNTTTTTGLRTYAQMDKNKYPKGIKITDEQLAQVNLEPHNFHPKWNYTIKPTTESLKN